MPLPSWYRRLLQVQFGFGGLYGVLLLIAPILLIQNTVPPAQAPMELNPLSHRVLEDFALWLGAAHLCFAAIAYVGLGEKILDATALKAIALPSLVYFAISSFIIDPRSLFVAQPDTWQWAFMVPAMLAEVGFSVGHAVMLARAARDSR